MREESRLVGYVDVAAFVTGRTVEQVRNRQYDLFANGCRFALEKIEVIVLITLSRKLKQSQVRLQSMASVGVLPSARDSFS